MTETKDHFACHVGEVVSLTDSGHVTQARVLSRSWSPALGEVLQLREDRDGQPSPIILLYGDLLQRVLPVPAAACSI